MITERDLAIWIASALIALGVGWSRYAKWKTRDRLVRDARPYAAALQTEGAPLEIFESEGGGHAVNEERPAEVLDVVQRFLRTA